LAAIFFVHFTFAIQAPQLPRVPFSVGPFQSVQIVHLRLFSCAFPLISDTRTL